MAKFKLLAFGTVMLAGVLAGCAASAGARPQVVSAASDTIRLQWDPQQTSEAKVLGTARAFCGGRNFDEVPSPQDAAAPGPLKTKTWRCQMFPGSGAGM